MSSNSSSFSDYHAMNGTRPSDSLNSKRKHSSPTNQSLSICLEDAAKLLSSEPPSATTFNLNQVTSSPKSLEVSSPNYHSSPCKMQVVVMGTNCDSTSIQSDNANESIVETDSVVEKVETTTDCKELRNPHSPKETPFYVKTIIQQWGSTVPLAAIHPDKFLTRILTLRGYNSDFIKNAPKTVPTTQQIQDYDQEIVQAVRESDLSKVKLLQSAGRSMSACNKFAESIVHMACRRADVSIVEYLLETGGDCNIVDDYGRNPLHDACWRPEPRFDIVTLLLDRNIDLLLMTDIRGASPLSYVRPEHWLLYCAYFYHQKEKYWREKPSPSTTENKLDDTHVNSIESKRPRF